MSNPSLRMHGPDENRHDFYHTIHKALRLGHCRMLTALGANDFNNETKTHDLMASLRGLILLGRTHLESENREIHTALEVRAPGASAHAAVDHIHHEQAFVELESLVRAVEVAVNSRRCIAGRALYKRYAVFAAADMQHMHEEETELLSALHRVFSDDELKVIEERIVTAIPPDKMMQYLRLMAPAMNHGERVAFLAKLQAAMPPVVFEAILADAIQPALEQNDYSAVVTALGGRRAA